MFFVSMILQLFKCKACLAAMSKTTRTACLLAVNSLFN